MLVFSFVITGGHGANSPASLEEKREVYNNIIDKISCVTAECINRIWSAELGLPLEWHPRWPNNVIKKRPSS